MSESDTQLLLALICMHLEQRQIRLLWWYFPDCTIIKRIHTELSHFLQPKNAYSKISSRKKPCNYSSWSCLGSNILCQKSNYRIYHKARTSGLTGLMIKFLEHLTINLSLERFFKCWLTWLIPFHSSKILCICQKTFASTARTLKGKHSESYTSHLERAKMSKSYILLIYIMEKK